MTPADRYTRAAQALRDAERTVIDAESFRRLLEARTAEARTAAESARRGADAARVELGRARAAMLATETGLDELRELAAALRDGANDDDIKSLAIALVERFTIITETP